MAAAVGPLVRRAKWSRRELETAAVTALLVVTTLVFLLPILLMIAVSFKTPVDVIAAPPRWLRSQRSWPTKLEIH